MRKLVLALAVAFLAVVPAAHAATKLTITGAGFGHGIGMSQYGAYGYSLHLKDYNFILGHYYTGTTLAKLDSNPEVKVLLQGGKHAVSFSGAVAAGDLKLDVAKTYTVRRGDGGLVRGGQDGGHAGTSVAGAWGAGAGTTTGSLSRSEAATAGPSAALARYEAYRRSLRVELGSDPGPALQAVHRQLLQGEAPAVRYGVPHEPNPLLGRDDDIAAVRQMLENAAVERREAEREAVARIAVGPFGDEQIVPDVEGWDHRPGRDAERSDDKAPDRPGGQRENQQEAQKAAVAAFGVLRFGAGSAHQPVLLSGGRGTVKRGWQYEGRRL